MIDFEGLFAFLNVPLYLNGYTRSIFDVLDETSKKMANLNDNEKKEVYEKFFKNWRT